MGIEFFSHTLFTSLSKGPLMALSCVVFLLGLLFTIKGGDWFVDSASWFAEKTGIPKFVVGATVVSFATTLPEMLVSIRAAMSGSTELAIGNAVGSVTANTALIMGVSLCAMAGATDKKSFRLKGALFIASAVSLCILSIKGALPVWSCAILWAIFLAFMIYNIVEGKQTAALDGPADFGEGKLSKNIVFFILGTAGIVLGAEFFVGSAKTLARGMGISEGIIGFTIIAVGTSLPELVTTLTAIRKKEASLSVGNIVGANVIDLTLILPLCSIISRKALPVAHADLVFNFPICIAAALIACVPAMITGKFKKWQGVVLLVLYAIYLLFLVLNEMGIVVIG